MAVNAAEERVVERGAHHVVHQTVREEAGGLLITNQFTILQPGISYWSEEEEEYQAASDQIQLLEVGAETPAAALRVKFSPNHNTPAGALEYTLPDGRRIKTQTVGLALTDNQDSVWIGELKDVNGILDAATGNTIYYPDAFTGIKADIRVRVGIGKVESDVILREKVIQPQLLGLDPATTYLEVFHRILDWPEPIVREDGIQRDGWWDRDVQLDFGGVLIGQGTAFLIGTNQLPVSQSQERVPVAKEVWEDDPNQRVYLIERIPLSVAMEQINALPDRVEAEMDRDSMRKRLEESRAVAQGKKRRTPVSMAVAKEPTPPGNGEKKVAAITRQPMPEEPGYLLDYTILVSAANFRFAGDRTYYVTNEVNLSVSTILEGGVVVKFNSGTTPILKIHGSLDCQTSLYAPATFTAKDDDSIGETVSGSTGTPSGSYGDYHLYFSTAYTNSLTVHDVRSRYARVAMGFLGSASHELYNAQTLFCVRGILAYGNTVAIRNYLAESALLVLSCAKTNTHFIGEHFTVHKAVRLLDHDGFTGGDLYLTNSLLISVTNSSTSVTTKNVTSISSDAGVFQTMQAGAHYLASDSAYRGAGTTGISATMSNILKTSSTWAPAQLSTAFALDTTLFPFVQRGVGTPDLGFAYPALDYIWTSLDVTNATLTLTNGVCIAGYGEKLIALKGTGTLVSEGQPHRLNRLVTFHSVQEQPSRLITNSHQFVDGYSATLRFTEVSAPAQPANSINFPTNSANPHILTISDSVLRNVVWWVENPGGSTNYPAFDLKNNLLERCFIRWAQGDQAGTGPGYIDFSLRNNLFYRSTLYFTHWGTNYGNWSIYYNVFDNCDLTLTELDSAMPPIYGGHFANADYNGYPSSAYFGGGHNGIGALSYENGLFGRRYYPSGMAFLVNAADITAAAGGLYQHTVKADQTKEGSTVLDEGFHYVAGDAATGLPIDTDGDGIPDYLEDRDGDGTADAGESDWNSSDGAGTGPAVLIVYTPLQ